jgi:hypothetical protein
VKFGSTGSASGLPVWQKLCYIFTKATINNQFVDLRFADLPIFRGG